MPNRFGKTHAMDAHRVPSCAPTDVSLYIGKKKNKEIWQNKKLS